MNIIHCLLYNEHQQRSFHPTTNLEQFCQSRTRLLPLPKIFPQRCPPAASHTIRAPFSPIPRRRQPNPPVRMSPPPPSRGIRKLSEKFRPPYSAAHPKTMAGGGAQSETVYALCRPRVQRGVPISPINGYKYRFRDVVRHLTLDTLPLPRTTPASSPQPISRLPHPPPQKPNHHVLA